MAEQFSMPSMFDTRYAMDRQMQTDAHAAGIAGGGGKRYGMYYNSSLLGDRDNASLMSLTGMMGGQGDPRIQKQNAIDTIMQQYPNPETAEDFRAIANALQQQGLYDESNRAMSMANDITASKPTRAIQADRNGVKRYVDTGEEVFEGVTKTPVAETYSTTEFKTTNEQGQDVTETWQIDGSGKVYGDKPLFSQVTSTEPGFDDKINQAVLDSYIHTETQKLRVANSQPLGNAQRLSEEEIITAGEANGRVEYNRVENAPAAGTPSVFSEKLAVWDAADEDRRIELVATGFFDGDAVQVTIENAINTKGQDAYAQTMGEMTATADLELVQSMKPAMLTLENTQEVFRLLDDKKVTTGIGATYVTNAKRIGNQVMKLFGADVKWEEVSKDQYLEALLGSQVFAMIKTLGIGARGLDTPAERDFLISVMTGTRTMDAGAIKRLTRLRQEIAAEAVNIYNEKIANGSLDNFIILDRNLKDDGSDDFKAKLAQAKIEMTKKVPEMYQGTWDRPVEHEIVVWDGEDTEYVTWENRYYDSENREISWEDLNRTLNPKGGQ